MVEKITINTSEKRENNIKKLRKERGLTQQELADIMKVTRRGLQRWEGGEVTIKDETAERLANFFNVSVPYLLGYDNQAEPFNPLKLFQAGLNRIIEPFQTEGPPNPSNNEWIAIAEKEYIELGLEGTIIELPDYLTFYAMELKEPLKELLYNFAKSPKDNQQAVLSLLRSTAKNQNRD